jgi:4-oxalmesaconate hydratase
MIIDCDGRYTNTREVLANRRDRQIAANGLPSHRPSPSELHMSDEELRESIESNPLAKMRACRSDLTIFSPRASVSRLRYLPRCKRDRRGTAPAGFAAFCR